MSILIVLYCLDIYQFLFTSSFINLFVNMNSKQVYSFYSRANQEIDTVCHQHILIFRKQHLHKVGLKTLRFYQFLRLKEKNSHILTHGYKNVIRKGISCYALNDTVWNREIRPYRNYQLVVTSFMK